MKKNPEFKLIIDQDVNKEFYAETHSFNGRTIWKTSESYKTSNGLIKAINYLREPEQIIIESTHLTSKQKLNLITKIEQIWMESI